MTMTNYKKEAAEHAAKEAKQLQTLAPKFPVPEGFTGSWTKDGWQGEDTFVLANADASIRFIFRHYGSGTTEFRLADGSKRNFDRRGVNDSFYWRDWDQKPKPRAELADDLANQLADVAKRLEFHKSAIKVPELGYSISPDTKAVHVKTLKAGKPVTFMPSGFGTGYYVSCKRPARAYGVRAASKALIEFYGVGPLFIQNFDAD